MIIRPFLFYSEYFVAKNNILLLSPYYLVFNEVEK